MRLRSSIASLFAGLIGISVFASLAAAADREHLRKNFLGKVPPEIVASKDEWLNDAPPTKLEQLRGHVVWLQFNF